MKICSLLPSATEIVCSLGLEDQLVGISHVCDYPESVLKSDAVIITRRSSDLSGLSSQKIDEIIKFNREQKIATQIVDGDLLKKISPDVILTQELCYVCAVEYGAVCEITLDILDYQPKIVSLKPAGIQDILNNILLIADACDVIDEGNRVVDSIQTRIDFISKTLAQNNYNKGPKTFCIDWLNPLRNTGQWIPELIELAGGNEGLAEKNGKSREVSWSEVVDYDPDFIFSMPCAFPMHEVDSASRLAFSEVEQFNEINAVKKDQVYLFDGQIPSRHGPRFIDVLENFAAIMYPDLFNGLFNTGMYTKYSL